MLLVALVPLSSQAKGYSSGGHSYSSGSHSSSFSSSRSSSSGTRSSGGFQSGGGKSYSSGSSSSGGGKSYSSGSSSSGGGRSYTSGRSYSSGSDHLFSSHASGDSSRTATRKSDADSSRITFDSAAARARKEEGSRQDYARFKDTQRAPGASGNSGYQGQPPPIIRNPSGGSYRTSAYVPDAQVLVSRPVRIHAFYAPYYSRPVVVYHDPYSSFFWWWLLDRSLDDRAYWAYHHRYDMDPGRYQSLMATDQQLETRVAQLEAQAVARDPHYVPTGLDQDLMYSDHYVNQAYNTRPTLGGQVAFWVLGIPTALAFSGFFIWLIWFKRWQTAT